MNKIRLLVFTLLACCGNVLYAQNSTISGQVVDQNDDPIPGATITVKGSNLGTVTDLDGNWTLSAPEAATIVVSFVGMTTQEIEVGTRSVVDVTLEEDAKKLNEVVVTAFGIEQERKALSYSAQKVENKIVTQAAQPNLSNALQGKVAGLDVRQSSGMPGSSSYMTIRGATFMNPNASNAPLIVVDGMPIESEPVFTNNLTNERVAGTDASSRMLDINPEDIESVNVLKGASAAALYGVRAANGVIIITTKKGNGINGGMKVTYSTSYTADVVTRLPKLQSTYSQGMFDTDPNVNAIIFDPTASTSWGIPIEEMGEYVNNVGETVTGQVYDNVNPFFKTGHTLTNNVGLSGATDKGAFNLSFGATNQSGFIPTTGMDRYNGSFSGEFKLTDKLSVGSSMMYSNMHVDKIASGSNLSNPLFTTYFAPRSYDLWGTPYHVEGQPYNQIHYRAAMDNPRWSLANNAFTEDNDRFIGNIHFGYEIIEGLKFKYQIGMDQFTNSQKEVYELGSGDTGGRRVIPTAGQITDLMFTQRQLNSNANLTFNKSFGDFNMNLLVGNEIYKIDSRRMRVVGTGFSMGGFHNISNTQNQNVTESVQERLVLGYYTSLSFDWKETVYLNGSLRNDVASNLASSNRSFLYPSVGTSVVFTELFNIPQNIISSGKIRAGYAEVGQLPSSNYGTQNIFVSGRSGSGFLSDDILFPFAGQNGFSQYSVLRSPNLKAQNMASIELGLEIGFLNDRINVDYTYFSTDVEDQIFEVPVAPSSGYLSELRNAGTLNSQGHEITLNLVPLQTSNFRWDIGVNFTKYNNKVKELAEGVESIQLGGFTTPSIRALRGGSFPSIYGIGYLRDDEGRIVVLDDPGNIFHGMPIADPEAKKIGDVQPDFTIGFNTNITYKGVTLSALVDWRQGGEMYSGNNRLGNLYGILAATEDRETPVVLDNTVKGNIDPATNEAIVNGENDIEILKNEFYWRYRLASLDEAHVYETTFVRFRELSIGYTLPSKWLNKVFLNSATVSVVGRNLALWSKYPNFDPESSTTGATNGQGLEYVAHPQVASYGAKLSVTF